MILIDWNIIFYRHRKNLTNIFIMYKTAASYIYYIAAIQEGGYIWGIIFYFNFFAGPHGGPGGGRGGGAGFLFS